VPEYTTDPSLVVISHYNPLIFITAHWAGSTVPVNLYSPYVQRLIHSGAIQTGHRQKLSHVATPISLYQKKPLTQGQRTPTLPPSNVNYVRWA
jgi:hypothetical protein